MKFQITIPVHFSDSDKSGHMSAKSILKAMLESSMRHSDQVNKSIGTVGVWVLYRWQAEFFRFPMPGTTLNATTYTTGFEKFYAYRDFLLYEGESRVARATTTWLLLDPKTFRPMRVPKDMADAYSPEPAQFVLPVYERADTPEDAQEVTLPVRTYDIDGNDHVNNLVYVDWVLESIPIEFRDAHSLRELQLTYRKQVLFPETVVSRCADSGGGIYSHEILEESSQELRAWAITKWEKN